MVLPFALIAAPMRRRIHAPRHTALNDQAAGGEINRKPFRHAGAVQRWMACANDSNAGLGEDIDCPAHVENQRRIVNLFRARRVRGIIERDQLNTRCGRSCNLLLSQFHCSTSADGLCGNG
jgi:hypothetical protein